MSELFVDDRDVFFLTADVVWSFGSWFLFVFVERMEDQLRAWTERQVSNVASEKALSKQPFTCIHYHLSGQTMSFIHARSLLSLHADYCSGSLRSPFMSNRSRHASTLAELGGKPSSPAFYYLGNFPASFEIVMMIGLDLRPSGSGGGCGLEGVVWNLANSDTRCRRER